MLPIAMAVVVGVLSASVMLWGAAWRQWRAGLPLIPATPRNVVPWGLSDFIYILTVIIKKNLIFDFFSSW